MGNIKEEHQLQAPADLQHSEMKDGLPLATVGQGTLASPMGVLAPFPTYLPADPPGQQWTMTDQVLGVLSPSGKPRERSWLLPLDWPSPGLCRHVEAEQGTRKRMLRHNLSLSKSPTVSVTLSVFFFF